MEQKHSLEADQSLHLVKKFPYFYGIRKFFTVPILSQLHPVPTTPSNFLKIHPNIILPSTSGPFQWPLSLRFPHQHPVHPSLLPHMSHMPHPSHSSRFNHLH